MSEYVNESHQLDEWSKIVAPNQTENFIKRLEWSGYTPNQALWALNPPEEAIPAHPNWLDLLTCLRQVLVEAGCSFSQAKSTKQDSTKSQPLPFEELWFPLCDWGVSELKQRLSPDFLEGVSDDAVNSLTETLLTRLCHLSEKVLWEEFHKGRTPGQILLAHLGENGDGSGLPIREAYLTFIHNNLKDGLEKILTIYPVLGRLLATVVELWLESSVEFLKRIHESRQELEIYFDISINAKINKIQQGMSDFHRGGCSVAVLHFKESDHEGEKPQKVVYKPKDMNVDFVYQRLLGIINQQIGENIFRVLKILPRQGFGFMEFVEHRPCVNDHELSNFYKNAGRLIAVLHILGCTDCHHENLIASGEQLILIDTETLLEGDVGNHTNNDNIAISRLQESMKSSVLRIGLLPQWLFIGRKAHAVDISALGILPPTSSYIEQPGWLGINSDGMFWGEVETPVYVPTSSPFPISSSNRLKEFQGELCEGFRIQMQHFIDYRQAWLDSNSILRDFAGLPRRIILRATRIYFLIQLQCLEPASLKNAIAYSLKLEQLARSYVLSIDKPIIWAVFEAELRQMEQLDIPFFEHLIDSNALTLSDGLHNIEHFLDTSGLLACRRRLEELSIDEVNFQIQLIKGAIEAKQIKVSSPEFSNEQINISNTFPGSDRKLDEVIRIAKQLQQQAIRDQRGYPEWLGIDIGQDQEKFNFGLVSLSLYGGRCGITLLFAALTHFFRQQNSDLEYQESLVNDICGSVAQILDIVKSKDGFLLFRYLRDQPLGLSGTGGILLTLQILNQLEINPIDKEFPSYERVTQKIIDCLASERINKDQECDVISGCAGLIGPLLSIAQDDERKNLSSQKPLDLAIICGEHLISQQMDDGGWLTLRDKKPLTGFSHGVSGIIAALARLYHVTEDVRFFTAIQKGLVYERSVFCFEKRNWPDFRSSSEPIKFMNSWCHGAPGIALSRLCLKESGIWDEQIATEMEMALETTAKQDTGVDHLCCGSFGRAAILKLASDFNMGDKWDLFAQKIVESSLKRASSQNSYRLFSTQEGELLLPGAFTGMAGIGLQLLSCSSWKTKQIVAQCLTSGLLLF
ncbi:MAG: type 2 lanthipeptide synthetase LanM family protein [Bacteroidota bacterium]